MSFVRIKGFLPTFGDAMRMATETRRAEEVFPSNGVGCPSSLHTQKRQKICKLPRFTKSGQEPTLSGRTLCFSISATLGAISLFLPHNLAAERWQHHEGKKGKK